MVRNCQIRPQHEMLIFHIPRHFVTYNTKFAGGLFIASHQECTPQCTKAHSALLYDKETTTDYIEDTWVVV